MATDDALALLEQGVEAWNRARDQGLHPRPNLRNASLRGRDLAEIDLGQADLSGADLTGSRLVEAELYKANLNSATLVDADLTEADLTRAELTEADLTRAVLRNATLLGAQLGQARMVDADLTRADLGWTSFVRTDLTGASLREAVLIQSVLHRPILERTDFTGALIGSTIFAGVDLRPARGLEQARYRNPSELTLSTFFLSQGKVPKALLQGAEVPADFVSLTHPLFGRAGDYYSCFISYSHQDKSFAQRLYKDLQARGIRVWLDDHQVLPGDSLYDAIDRGIRLWDKVLLCCSKSSLHSHWVDTELGKALEKEERLLKEQGRRVLALIPLNLDGYLFSWPDGKASLLKARLAPDLSGWQEDKKKYRQQLEKLIRALRTDEGGREAPPEARL